MSTLVPAPPFSSLGKEEDGDVGYRAGVLPGVESKSGREEADGDAEGLGLMSGGAILSVSCLRQPPHN